MPWASIVYTTLGSLNVGKWKTMKLYLKENPNIRWTGMVRNENVFEKQTKEYNY